MGSFPLPTELDAVIVGAGFGGAYQLKRLREEGYNVKLIDNATSWGGVWYWNRYPGACVDSTIPHYEFSDPKIWKEWRWKERFPGSEELRQYFEFVAKNWDLNKDAIFSTTVTSTTWDEESSKWLVTTNSGEQFTARYLLLNTGFSAKRHIPNWPGIEKFRGTFVHPSYWPKQEPDLSGKRVAVIGTGSTGIQLAQEMSKVAGEFVLFQRTPHLTLPMKQVEYDGDGQAIPASQYPGFFKKRNETFGGFDFNFLTRGTFDDSPEKRQETYEELWSKGDFHFWLATYRDMLFDEEANKEAKVRARIQDPRLQEILAPEIQPHALGCKRISLENGFYEIFNQPNVKLVDMKSTPITEVTEKGLKNIDISGVGGQKLTKTWEDGTKTYLGITVSGFPNMFFTYGPQAPTALCNGPTCAELQGGWIVQMMNNMRKDNKRRIEASLDAEKKWGEDVWKFYTWNTGRSIE